jgi:hypothetical protein
MVRILPLRKMVLRRMKNVDTYQTKENKKDEKGYGTRTFVVLGWSASGELRQTAISSTSQIDYNKKNWY